LALATSEDSKLHAVSGDYETGQHTHIPCSRNFFTFHMVINAVGDEEIIMIGWPCFAFRARGSAAVISAHKVQAMDTYPMRTTLRELVQDVSMSCSIATHASP
jgi:hypothetical protein